MTLAPFAPLVNALRLTLARFAFKAAGGSWQQIIRADADRAANRFFPDLGIYRDQAEVYRRSSWVYIAVNRVATDSAVVNLQVMQFDGEDKTELPNHPLEQLLRRPNDWQSQLEFLYATVAFLELTGNAYWFLNGGPGGAPTALMLLRPDRVQIVPGPDSDTRVKGYVYRVDDVEVPLDASEVIHFALWHPSDDYYGLSRLEAAALAVTTDLAMQKTNRNVFANGRAVPAGIVNIKNYVDDTNYDRIRKEWERNYGGTQQKTAFIRGADVEWQNVGLSQRELEFIEGRQFSKEEIFQIFGVWPGMLDKNATEANALAAFDVYEGRTVWPGMLRITQKITVALCPYYGTDLICEPEDIRKKDRAGDRDDLKVHAPYMSLNEIRTRFLDLDPYEGDPETDDPADVPEILRKASAPANPFDQQGNVPAQLQRPERNLIEATTGKTLDIFPDVPRVYVSRAMQREIEQFARYATKGKDVTAFTFNEAPTGLAIALRAVADASQFDLLTVKSLVTAAGEPKARVSLMGQLSSALVDYFEGLTVRLVKGARHVNAPSTGKALPDMARFRSYFDKQFWTGEFDRLKGAMLGLIHDLVEAGYADVADALQMATGLAVDVSTSTRLAADYAATYTDAILRDFQTTTQSGFGAILERYISTPDATIADLVTAIQETPLLGIQRANLVAVTEATRAYGAGNYLAGEALAETAGVGVAIAQTDFSDLLPAHPNCRCGVSAEFVYEGSTIMRLDYRWYTANDDATCPICAPRHGRLVSEL